MDPAQGDLDEHLDESKAPLSGGRRLLSHFLKNGITAMSALTSICPVLVVQDAYVRSIADRRTSRQRPHEAAVSQSLTLMRPATQPQLGYRDVGRGDESEDL
jgi:hypothetical protein